MVDARCCHVDEKGVKKRVYACCADNGMKGNFFHRVGTFRALWEEPRITKASMTFIADLMPVDPVQAVSHQLIRKKTTLFIELIAEWN